MINIFEEYLLAFRKEVHAGSDDGSIMHGGYK